MSRKEPADARERALHALTDIYDGEQSGHLLLEQMQAKSPLGAPDAGLAAELVLGVTRNRLTCEHIAAHFYHSRWESLRPAIRNVYSLGIYQLCWLERIPDHAAVDQTVRLARRHGIGIAQSVNAILRNVASVRGSVIDQPPEVNPRRFLSIDEQRGRMFSEDIFPDPARRPLEYLVAATSHPAYLVERWHRRFKPALCRSICEAGRRRPPLVLRPNKLRTNAVELLKRLNEAGHRAERLADSDAIVLREPVRAGDLPEFQEGLCQPQDSTSQRALLLAPRLPGETVLDLCAGVGTKSTQAAELMSDRGLVLASDVDQAKLNQIPEAATRLGITIIQTRGPDDIEQGLKSLNLRPDWILVDAPCSNTGVLARRPEARYRASHKNLISLATLQREILSRAVELCGDQTRIIYSTCSIEREENEDQVEWFTKTFSRFTAANSHFVLPDRDRDGGFAVLFVPS